VAAWAGAEPRRAHAIDMSPFAIVEAAVKKEVSQEADGLIRSLEPGASKFVVAFRAF
jgi:hypothetical protein